MAKVSEYIEKRLAESEEFRIEYEKEKLSKELEKLRKEKDLNK